MAEKKIKSICIDTLTGIQVNEYMMDKRKPSFDKWKDYGQSIYIFMTQLQEMGFELVLILGDTGTGKSYGMRTLDADTNIWYNADNKNPVWKGGRQEYGKKANPKTPYHIIPKTYDDIISHIQGGIDKGMFEEERVAFLTGHTETYKEGDETKVRLKTLGNMATNMQLEGKLEIVLYSTVEFDGQTPQYLLQTQNSGYNTARSPQDMLEPKIPNDYKLILDSMKNY